MHSLQLQTDKCESFIGIFSLETASGASGLPWPWCRKLAVQPPCWQLCPARLPEQRPGVHGHKRRSASRGDGGAPGWWRSGWGRPPPHSGLQTGSKCLESHMTEYSTCAMCLLRNLFCKRARLVLWLTWHSSRDSAPQSSHCSHGDLLRGVLCGAGVSSCDHVGLQQSALQVHMVIRQSLVHSSQDLTTRHICYHTSCEISWWGKKKNLYLNLPDWDRWWWTNLFCDILAALQVVRSVRKDLWLHNGHQAVLMVHMNVTLKWEPHEQADRRWRIRTLHTHLLADTGISGKDISVLCNSKGWWAAIWDLQHTPPLGKVTAVLLVLGAPLREAIKTWEKCPVKLMFTVFYSFWIG